MWDVFTEILQTIWIIIKTITIGIGEAIKSIIKPTQELISYLNPIWQAIIYIELIIAFFCGIGHAIKYGIKRSS